MSGEDKRDEIRKIKENLLHHTGLLSGHLGNLFLSSDDQQRNIMYIRREINTIITKLSLINEDCAEETEEEIGICIDMGEKFAILTERDSILNERRSIDEWATRINALKLIPSDLPSEREDEETIIILAKKGLDRILGLSRSQLISEKLQSLNILLFTFIIAVSITFYLGGTANEDLAFLAVLAVSYIISLIVSIAYGYILEIGTNISAYKIESLRIGIIILFTSLSLSISALIFNNILINNISLGLILIQLLIIPFSSVFTFNEVIEDKEIESSQLWNALGKISMIIGIISFVVDIALILYSLI